MWACVFLYVHIIYRQRGSNTDSLAASSRYKIPTCVTSSKPFLPLFMKTNKYKIKYIIKQVMWTAKCMLQPTFTEWFPSKVGKMLPKQFSMQLRPYILGEFLQIETHERKKGFRDKCSQAQQEYLGPCLPPHPSQDAERASEDLELGGAQNVTSLWIRKWKVKWRTGLYLLTACFPSYKACKLGVGRAHKGRRGGNVVETIFPKSEGSHFKGQGRN